MKTYPPLTANSTIFEFGDAKLRANDIDPLYGALIRSGMTHTQLCEFTLTFVSFDHAGIASRIMGLPLPAYWQGMLDAVKQTTRGAPRRYYRGPKALASVRALQARYGSAAQALAALAGPYADAKATIHAYWPGFGPCAAFKLCDMAERVCGIKVDFKEVTVADICSNAQVQKGFDKARNLLARQRRVVPQNVDLVGELFKHKWATKAPPLGDRNLNSQEFETILCYYSHDFHNNKHLPGMDVVNIRNELTGYGALADKLITCLGDRK